jgi:putative tricarboxylic transport membrane protein
VNRSRVVAILLIVATLIIAASSCGASTKYPEKPITLVVHAAAGGGSDIFARTLAAGFQENNLLPQPIVVENKPGGSGAVPDHAAAG